MTDHKAPAKVAEIDTCAHCNKQFRAEKMATIHGELICRRCEARMVRSLSKQV